MTKSEDAGSWDKKLAPSEFKMSIEFRMHAQHYALATDFRRHGPTIGCQWFTDAVMSLKRAGQSISAVNAFLEGVTGKIRRQADELERVTGVAADLSVHGLPAEMFLSRFQWDEMKHPINAPLRETVDKIQQAVARLEDDLKVRSGEYMTLKNQLMAITRKATGSLAVRDLSTLISKEELLDTEHMTTLLVVVPKYNVKDWLGCYESLSQYVVPRSSKKIVEENDYALFTVVLFKKVVDAFSAACRERSFQVREFSLKEEPKEGATNAAENAAELKAGLEAKQTALIQWCSKSYGEVFSEWMHLCALRLFVESILRYGLPPKFVAAVVKPNKKVEKKVRTALAQAFGGSSKHWQASEDDSKDIIPGVDSGAEVFPYVSLTINI
eukprot:jgi/Mesvir1/9191/Mv15942-RA.1